MTGDVAELRQLDSSPPPIDITPGTAPPESPAAGRRQRRIALLAAAAAAVVVAGGAGYAAVRPAEPARATAPPRVTLPAVPLVPNGPPQAAGPPAADPVTPSPAPSGTVRTPSPAATSRPAARPVVADPPAPASSPPTGPAPASSTPAGPWLTAVLSGGGEWTGGGLAGYGGTLRLDNAGWRTAGRWQVTLTVPGGSPVHAGGPVAVTQDGEHVTFSPGGPGGGIPPGGSLTFGFWIDGLLPGPPYGCALHGRPCS